ncbi:exonuclease V [Dipodascopsis tothii]|uniref:exonuclease V n=1 Tax=Dipodascopsis tothii TaxID=44089 RepID=UPI0034CFE598
MNADIGDIEDLAGRQKHAEHASDPEQHAQRGKRAYGDFLTVDDAPGDESDYGSLISWDSDTETQLQAAVEDDRASQPIEYETDSQATVVAADDDVEFLMDQIISYDDVRGFLVELSSQSTEAEVVADDGMLPLNLFDNADARAAVLRPGLRAFSVTQLSSPSSWCELQYFYQLYTRTKPTPEQMAIIEKGRKIHEKIERELLVPFNLTPETAEAVTRYESQALKLVNMLTGLHSLYHTGKTRELRMYGTVDGRFVSGIIDEVVFDRQAPPLPRRRGPEGLVAAEPPRSPSVEPEHDAAASTLKIVEYKTRNSRQLPMRTQMRSHHHQLMWYHDMMRDLIDGRFVYADWARAYRIDLDRPLQEGFLAEVREFVEDEYDIPMDRVRTSADLWDLVIAQAAQFQGKLSNDMYATYIFQGDGEGFSRQHFPYRASEFAYYKNRVLELWSGQRQPVGVAIDETFKCRSCVFSTRCQWRLDAIRDAARLIKKSRVE